MPEILGELAKAAQQRCLPQTLWRLLPGLPKVLRERVCLQETVLEACRCLREADRQG